MRHPSNSHRLPAKSTKLLSHLPSAGGGYRWALHLPHIYNIHNIYYIYRGDSVDEASPPLKVGGQAGGKEGTYHF